MIFDCFYFYFLSILKLSCFGWYLYLRKFENLYIYIMSNPFKTKGGQEEKKGKLGIFGDSPESKPEGEKKDKLNIFGSKPEKQ